MYLQQFHNSCVSLSDIFQCTEGENLSSPNSLDGLCKTDVVGLELVKTDTGEDGAGLEDPHEGLLGARSAVAGEVIDNA